VDLIGKHGRVRTIPLPTWVKVATDAWTAVAGVVDGYVFRPVNRGGQEQLIVYEGFKVGIGQPVEVNVRGGANQWNQGPNNDATLPLTTENCIE
jgi:hypothetical protein